MKKPFGRGPTTLLKGCLLTIVINHLLNHLGPGSFMERLRAAMGLFGTWAQLFAGGEWKENSGHFAGGCLDVPGS